MIASWILACHGQPMTTPHSIRETLGRASQTLT